MKTAINFKSNADVRNFISNLSEGDFKGSKTKKSIKDKANMFLETQPYKDYETVKGLDIHQSLLCLIYDAV